MHKLHVEVSHALIMALVWSTILDVQVGRYGIPNSNNNCSTTQRAAKRNSHLSAAAAVQVLAAFTPFVHPI